MTKPARFDPNLLSADPRLKQLRAVLLRVERRFRIQEATSLAPAASALAAGAGLLLALIWRIESPARIPLLLPIVPGLLLASLAAVLLYALFRPRDLLATARKADRVLGLDERLSTALEDASRPPNKPSGELISLREAQLDDAVAAAGKVEPGRDMRVVVGGRKLAPALALTAVLLLAVFAPGLPSGNGEVQAQISTEQQRIEALAQELEKLSTAAEDPQLQELLRELQELTRQLEDGDLTREEAVARLSEAESRLSEKLDPQSPAQREALDQLAKQLAASQSEEARKMAEALQSGDMERLAEEMKDAADGVESMTPEQRKQLADDLRAARDRVVALDPELARRLNEAADALEKGDSEAAQRAAEELSKEISNTSSRVASEQQVQQALAQIQQSRSNIAQAGQATPQPGRAASGTAIAGGTPRSGSPVAAGSPVSGTPVTLGSPVTGTGTPVMARTTPGRGTPVAVPGQGEGQGSSQPGNSSGNTSGNSSGGNPSGGWGTGHQEPVYAPPSRANAALTPVTVQGQENSEGEQSSASTNTNANSAGSALVPYEQVYGQYEQEAGNALNGDYIPQGYKDLVRDYFSDIDPRAAP